LLKDRTLFICHKVLMLKNIQDYDEFWFMQLSWKLV
jgi:hypothetical protein